MPEPIGYLTALQFPDGTFDPDVDAEGLWPTLEHAEADAATPEMTGRLVDGQRWRACAVVPVKDGKDG
jgi:hypothetical protein